jgi:glycosyltransferase involved in cell wall biosynthesis
MRVVMVAWEYPPHVVGGMGRHVVDLVPLLVTADCELHIVTPLIRGGAPIERDTHGVWVHRVPAPAMDASNHVAFIKHSGPALIAAAAAIRRNHGAVDLIHAHDWLGAPAAIALKHAWRRPLIATIHATERGRQQGTLSSEPSRAIDELEWQLSYEAWRVIVCSQFMAHQLQRDFATPADKLDVIPNAVVPAVEPFASAAARLAMRRHFVADDAPLVLYVGRLVFEKGIHILLQAWPTVLGRWPNARLVIAGIGAMLDDLRDQARALGIDSTVQFAGFVSDEAREQLYRCADVAVFPSLYEPFGIVALEAMAAGCPVIASATGGLAEVVDAHHTGITVAPNNSDSLAWGIEHVLAHPDWSLQRARRARELVQRIWTWERVAQQTIAVYHRVVAAWRAGSWGTEAAP